MPAVWFRPRRFQHRRGFLLQASQFIMVRQLSRVDRYWQECYRVRSSHETECEPFQRCQTTCHTTMQSFAPRHEPFGPFGPGDVNAGDCRFGPPRCIACQHYAPSDAAGQSGRVPQTAMATDAQTRAADRVSNRAYGNHTGRSRKPFPQCATKTTRASSDAFKCRRPTRRCIGVADRKWKPRIFCRRVLPRRITSSTLPTSEPTWARA